LLNPQLAHKQGSPEKQKTWLGIAKFSPSVQTREMLQNPLKDGFSANHVEGILEVNFQHNFTRVHTKLKGDLPHRMNRSFHPPDGSNPDLQRAKKGLSIVRRNVATTLRYKPPQRLSYGDWAKPSPFLVESDERCT
jgi:hypothetical protein